MQEKILICIPPLGQVNYPYIAVPLLKSVLEARGFSVAVADANIACLNHWIAHIPNPAVANANINNPDAHYWNENYLALDAESLPDEFLRKWASNLAIASRLIAFSIISAAALTWSLKAASQVKSSNSEAVVIMGGAFFDAANARFVLAEHPAVDIIVVGEAETTLTELMRHFHSHSLSALKNIPGIVWRRRNGAIVANKHREFIPDLDDLPFPDFSCLPLHSYLNNRNDLTVLPILGSRSCSGQCVFCSERSRWGRYRHRSPENILLEMQHQTDKHKVDIFRFNDSVLNTSHARLERLCDLIIEARLDIQWVGNVRLSSRLTAPLLRKMHDAGCRVLWFGVESASPRILKKMKKGINIAIAPEIFRQAREAGIRVLTFWITDFPGEKLADIRETVNFFRTHGRHIDFAHFSEYRLHKGSVMYENPAAFGLSLQGANSLGEPVWRYLTDPPGVPAVIRGVAATHVNTFTPPWPFIGMV